MASRWSTRASPAARSNARMDLVRGVWMRRMVEREIRIVDTTIMASLQNGTAFFASTSLIALGGALSFLRSPDETLLLFADFPVAVVTTRTAWEMKVIGLSVIFAYAFFKFAWSYRLMNYAAILIGATPNVDAQDDRRPARMAAPGRGDEHGCRRPFQPRPARLLLRARLYGLVHRAGRLLASRRRPCSSSWRRGSSAPRLCTR